MSSPHRGGATPLLDPGTLERIGVYTDEHGELFRHRIRTVNTEYDQSDPRAELKGLLVSYDEELVPHPVVLALATDARSVEDARQRAIELKADFYHPRLGWLRWGLKRETENPENLGSGTRIHQRRRVVVAEESGVRSHDVGAADVGEATRTGGAVPDGPEEKLSPDTVTRGRPGRALLTPDS